MGLNKKDLISLAKITAGANKNSKVAYSLGEESFSYSDLNETLRKEMNELVGTYSLYRENKNILFELIEQTINDVLPENVLAQYGQFAEIQTFAQGDRPIFRQKTTVASKRRAKQFITKVGLAGIYEVFKLDGQSYEVQTSAIGGAAQIGLEEFLDGRVDFAELVEIVLEGLDETIYLEVEAALEAAATNLAAANKTTQNSFVETEMNKLLAVADSYGQSAIYCTFEFAATMLPAEGWISDDMRNQRWNNGYLGNYKGHNVRVLRQSFTDETNSVKVIEPSNAWIIPGGAEKPVKIAFEGQTIVREHEHYDASRDIQVYKKVGVGTIVTNNICVYKNTSLTK